LKCLIWISCQLCKMGDLDLSVKLILMEGGHLSHQIPHVIRLQVARNDGRHSSRCTAISSDRKTFSKT
jgi:hypothetical protein